MAAGASETKVAVVTALTYSLTTFQDTGILSTLSTSECNGWATLGFKFETRADLLRGADLLAKMRDGPSSISFISPPAAQRRGEETIFGQAWMDRSMISHGLQFRSLSRSPEATNYRRWIKSLACLGKGAGAACGVNFQGHALELLARATVTGVTAGGVVQDGSALVLLLEELVAKKNSTRARSFSRFREQVDARSSSAVVAYRGCRCPLLDHEARAVHERQPGLRRREGWQRNAELW
eukprot:CAMPEP_0171591016 /NCGR_PEP_ID=MMETSP0961-20121227/15918_1 /TAXON_ID=87120 /ORGANISM="Aurantiochytrium limacinum, Strain ATCCMYA-1381" /LENGTH=237 /DNA_ID=CAMNT_0012150875 /DNA_START=364 /DNA_END=1075 /DNA_ORIENTATION=+